jgi:hypothetical protein
MSCFVTSQPSMGLVFDSLVIEIAVRSSSRTSFRIRFCQIRAWWPSVIDARAQT